jgi:WD40 repeat protein
VRLRIITHCSPRTRCVSQAPMEKDSCKSGTPCERQVWSVQSQKFHFTLSGHSNWVRTCRFSPDGLLAVSAGDDKAVRVWDIATRRCLRMYEQHLGQINTARYNPSTHSCKPIYVGSVRVRLGYDTFSNTRAEQIRRSC